MNHVCLFISALTLTLLLGACSSENDLAPGPGQVHPENWTLNHGPEANTDLTGCQICHGIDFNGSGEAVSCFDCHADGPPFIAHPASWVDIEQDHQTFYTTQSWTQCANAACHGTDMQGGDFGPSCFLASCHIGGPPAPHALPFQAALNHGPVAKGSQLECRNCHGRPPNIFDGGYVVEILGLGNSDGGNCSFSCHDEARAHPVNWQGTNDTGSAYTSSHRGEFNPACALCHKTDGPGIGPLPPAPSCFSADYQNSVSSVALECHSGGPGVPHIIGADWLLPSAHVTAWQANSPACFDCHAVNSGGIDPTCRSCHTRADPTSVSSGCTSCHSSLPPGTGQHNDHDNFSCRTCHYSYGTTSLQHWYPDPTSPADTRLDPNDSEITTMQFNKNASGSVTGCTGSCHSESHNDSW